MSLTSASNSNDNVWTPLFDRFNQAMRTEADTLFKNIADSQTNLINEHDSLRKEIEILKKEKDEMVKLLKKYDQIVTLNVGGQLFTTTMETLTKEECLFTKMFNGRYDLQECQGAIFIDRDSTHFRVLLNYLRTNVFIEPKSAEDRTELLLEAEYYQIPSLIIKLKKDTITTATIVEKLLFDPISHHPEVIICDQARKAVYNGAYATLLYAKVLNLPWYQGRHYWEVTLNEKNRYYASVGIATPSWDAKIRLGDDSFSWTLRMGPSWSGDDFTGLRHNNKSFPYYNEFAQDTRIGILLDLNEGTLEYIINGTRIGVAFTNVDCQESSSILLVDLLQFHNPTGITVNGQCCDGSFPSANFCPMSISCNLYTIVCLDLINSEIQSNWTSCPLGIKSTQIKANSTSLFNYYTIENITNIFPLQFQLPQINDDSIRIKIFVFYNNTSMLLNQFYTTFHMDSLDGLFQQMTLIDLTKNISNINQIIIGVKSYCRPTFYGKQCTIQCIPNNDCTSSYTCNSITGEKICSPGWYGNECSMHNISSTCLSSELTCFNGGFCRNNQSTCCCPIGFTGKNCQYLSTCIPDRTCLNGGSCHSTYDTISRSNYFICNCPTGYTGLYCQDKQQCPATYYGPNCTVQCSAPNSCSQGHFYCNSDGEKVCLYGWGPINLCTQKLIASIFDSECSVSTGCLNGGSCFNGSCCCPATYTGRLCEISIDPCTNNPCQNNALCLSTSTGYKCLCSSSIYTGSLCEINQNPCQYSPCQNGICQLLSNTSSFSCICYPGYTGQFCHIKINYCLSQPCENNGICASIATGYVCTCLSDFTGLTCSNRIHSCLTSSCSDNKTIHCPIGYTNPPNCIEDMNECLLAKEPCKNGGICINTIGSYYCQCNKDYQGTDCSIPIDPCLSNPCVASNSISCTSIMRDMTSIDFNCTCRVGFIGQHCEHELNPCVNSPCLHGKCVELTTLTRTCICEPGWTGIECSDNINECLSYPCLNAGICLDGINTYRCECLTGFMGSNCQNEINLCSSIPCQNNGTCINHIESYSCLCPIGWTGNLCEVNINECSFPLTCHPNSTCIDLPGSYQCICPSWLTGQNCLTAIDQCETFPCLNNGVCVNNYGNLPTCHCQAGFTGIYCEVNIDDCQATPCYNNGTCIDQINSFLCLCSSGYTDLRCQTMISQCNSLPCLNGGICRDSYDDFLCICPPFFTGKQCEQTINSCLSFPCLHGSCTPALSSYTCQCNSGYTGDNCETVINQCASSPCGSNGNCTSLSTRFSCCCAPGYTGLECNQLIDICLTNPCSIEGVERCISTGISSFNCLCKPGYSGRHCEININECLSQPCLHGGICIDFQNSYQCICPLTHTGVNCEYLQDKCVGIQCLNDGKCVNNGTSLTCLCSKGFQGENCELIVDYCQSQPCQNGGICSNTEFGSQCTCSNGISGLFCETIIDQCQSKPCQNNGTCKSLIDKYVCLCPNGFTGIQCENERNECEPVNPCLNSGRCIDGFNNFSCICNLGFTGYYCESQIDQCQSNPCLNGGICRTLINNFKCDCPQGYTGLTCSSMINYCSSNPCLNNGLCIPLINSYRCVCLDDFIGVNCEKTSNECLSNPCLNNGTCIDDVWNYTCRCPVGFVGSNCQMEKNYCESSPCLKGLCVNKLNGYDCICPSSSYTGVHCEIQINKCSSNPCLSGGTCIDGLENFMCICPAWYAGLTCSEHIDPCRNQTNCVNNGTCITDLNKKPFGYTCQCLPGFTGQMCEINVDDCISQPCKHGRCLDNINGFYCQCYQGYDGGLCDNAIDQCKKLPCQNNGTCQSLMNSYQCHCLSGFYGKNCEEIITEPCLTNSCRNNGTCIVTSEKNSQCTCLYGYTGRECEIKLNACDTNPCHYGTCKENFNGFYDCLCSSGYTGFHCEIELNPCDSLPCLHNGICSKSLLNTFNCTCSNGYYGKQCQLGGYQCHSGPCLNNGTCIINDNNYQCICPHGLTGNRCEIDINECESMPCQNNGICLQSKLNEYQCLCPTGYTGSHCEATIDPCLSIYCLNNGTCIRTSSTTGICSCLPGYTGISCQHQINTCLSAPCLNGTCVPLINSYQCNCFPGYTGQKCNSIIDYCSTNPCFNNGTCINQATSFACQCPYGFQGRTCVIRVQSCQSSPCLNGGICIDIAPGLHNCSCPSSYHGEFCQLRDSFCLDMPCQNNGLCLDTLNGYQCICQPGYNGINCTNEIQPCISNPCLNNGFCRNTNNGLSYQCLCEKGYAGLRCELEMNWCSSNPCQNQGTCISRLTSFTCVCPPIYTGIICQIPINNCSLTTCKYGLPLVTSLTSCSCICSNGYTGNQCDIPINPCLDSSYCIRGQCNYLSPGLANCTCPYGYSGLRCDTKLSNDACSSCPCLYGQCRIDEKLNDYICDCYQGYIGRQCEISIDLCKPSPCLYGQCILDEMNGYRCKCLPGAEGKNCSELIHTCNSNPCLNNGICVQGLNTYQCVCQSGYAGIHCEILINQCTSLICLNNGTCVNLPTNPPTAKCQCPSLFTGVQCQYPYAPCASQPCQNLGTCITNGLSSYTCLCPHGFTGFNCEYNIQVCNSQPCQNGGICSEPAPYYYLCQCLWPFYGINCELMTDPCLSYPCRGPSSQCISTPMYQNYTCLCSNGFEGSTCSIPIDPCRLNPCENNGSCIRINSLTYSCSCPIGYQGNHCEIEINPCLNYPCRNGLAIKTSAIHCECQCYKSYYGKACEMNICEKNPCRNGNCISNGNYSYTCDCPNGFQFLMGVCTDINECRTIPGICGNGGRCLNTYGSYQCFCKSNFYGKNCENFDPCQSMPCIHNGSCIANENYPYWQCHCPALYTGLHCETTLHSCLLNPCRTGTCINLPNGEYQCQCSEGMTGKNCDIPLLPCDSNPCLNNSTCLTLSLTNYTCVCPPLYSGLRCSEQRTSCSKNSCQGNATCIVHSVTGEEICQCPDERYGINCEFISACGLNPCIHGTCQNKNETIFQCICNPGFTGKTCDTSFNTCESNPCMNDGKCSNQGNGLFTCVCSAGYSGSDCSVPHCIHDSCFNDGICSIQNNSLQCQCPCGFTGSRCETPFDICSLTPCQNNGTRFMNKTQCQCSCLCPSTFTGQFCQTPIIPINRTYSGQIVIPLNRSEGSSWENILHCIDQVWNSLNVILVCPSSFTLATPTLFYPYCYRINQQNFLKTQHEAFEECEKQQTQLVWFQSMDELQQQLIPALSSQGLTRDFWTSGIYSSKIHRWQWLLTNNNTEIDIDSSITKQFGIDSNNPSLYVSFNQSSNQRLTSSLSSETYSTLCKISATNLLLNNQTRSIVLNSYQNAFNNQSQVIIYNFNYTILPTVHLNTPIQQPTDAHYAAMCGAIGNPSTSVEPYSIDICGYFSSITDRNVQLLMQTIGTYYSTRRMTITTIQPYIAIPLNIEHYTTISGNIMTRIEFIIKSGSSLILGSNIAPLASTNDILNTIPYRYYQQCEPYISLNILLKLKLCIPLNDISLWIDLITKAISITTEQSNVNIMLKGVQEGITTTGHPANIAYFLVTINGITYNETMIHNLSLNSILFLKIQQENDKLMCSKDTQILPLEYSIRDFYVPCPIIDILEKQLNNALHQAGIYTMNVIIFNIDEAVDKFGQIYYIPNIFLQHINGTWLDSSFELTNQFYEILIPNQFNRLSFHVYRLSKSYSYFYTNSLSQNDRNYLEKLLLTVYNQQNSILSNHIEIFYEDLYLNITSMKSIHRIYLFIFYNEQELDGRYLSSIMLSSGQFNSIPKPLNYISNQIPTNLIQQRNIQQITFLGKINKLLAEKILKDYWQNPIKQGLINVKILILRVQEYLAYSSKQFYTTITYIVFTPDSSSIPNKCFNANLIGTMNNLCNIKNNYLDKVPDGYIPSFIDLKGQYTQMQLEEDNFENIITLALQKINIDGKVSSILAESRFGLDMSLVTRIYYMIIPDQIITQEEIQDQLNFVFSSTQTQKYQLYPIEQISVSHNDTHQYIANISLPITTFIQKDIENYLTSFNPQYGQAKIVYAETINSDQTRFYLIFINGTQLITQCDFSLYYPDIDTYKAANLGIKSYYLDRPTFLMQSASLVDNLKQLWKNENSNVSIQLKNQIQYICSDGKRSVRIDYIMKNISLPTNSVFGKYVNDCISHPVRSIYLIEPRSSNKDIYEALRTAWRQTNNNYPITISSEFFIDSSYLTNKNLTLTRLIYTINSNSLRFISPLSNSINLSNIYTNIPYKRYTIYLENKILNSTVLSIINKALKRSWLKANSYLFSINDLFITSMNTRLSDDEQLRIDYLIGLYSDDIGDYSQPSENIYSQIFNETGLETLVYIRYIPKSSNEISINKDQLSYFPFDYRSGGPFYGLDWWVILIIIIAILTTWLILCLICYICFRKRTTNHYHHKISNRPTRRIDILAREQDHYLRPSLSSLAFDGPYAESLDSSIDDHQRISVRTISSQPELQVRRLSEQDWPHFAMHNPYGLSSNLSHTTTSNRPL
ncbi:unnamed protein product [Adineta steineri]|uniref:Uncharacterized protein n=1 Tax=Adineta steineri TaxID=433720 RepID=A0A818LNI2_9BILA|nr:unnamed protein product [Adineta steineri]